MPQLRETTWIVVADDVRARVLFSRGRGQPLERLPDGELQAATVDGDPSRGDVTPPEVGIRMDAERFAKELATRIEQAANRGAFDRLVLVAPPKTLGELRRQLSERTLRQVVGSVDKELTHHSDEEVRAHVAEVTTL